MYGLPNCSLIKLQRGRMPVLDWYLLRVDCHITPLVIKLHWLLIHSRIVFKILLLSFKILHGTALTYLESLISHWSLSHAITWDVLVTPSCLSNPHLYLKRHMVTGRLLEQHQNSGMHCHLKSETPSRWTFLNQS